MTVGELKQRLKGIDDNKKIGSSGWFGELLEIHHVWDNFDFVNLEIEYAGEEPN